MASLAVAPPAVAPQAVAPAAVAPAAVASLAVAPPAVASLAVAPPAVAPAAVAPQAVAPAAAAPPLNLQEFYDRFGTHYVSRVHYGQKLLAIVEVHAKRMSKTTQYAAKVRASVPLPHQSSVGGGVEISHFLESLQDDKNTQIRIFSIGDDAENLQGKNLKSISELRSEVSSFFSDKEPITTAKPSAPQTSEANTGSAAKPASGNAAAAKPATGSAATDKPATDNIAAAMTAIQKSIKDSATADEFIAISAAADKAFADADAKATAAKAASDKSATDLEKVAATRKAEAESAAKSKTAAIEAAAKSAAAAEAAGSKAATDKTDESQAAAGKKTGSQSNVSTVISFETSPYSNLLTAAQEKAAKAGYVALRKRENEANQFTKLVFKCEERIQLYSDLIHYARVNGNVINTDAIKKAELDEKDAGLRAYLEQLTEFRSQINENIFADPSFDLKDMAFGESSGQIKTHLNKLKLAVKEIVEKKI